MITYQGKYNKADIMIDSIEMLIFNNDEYICYECELPIIKKPFKHCSIYVYYSEYAKSGISKHVEEDTSRALWVLLCLNCCNNYRRKCGWEYLSE